MAADKHMLDLLTLPNCRKVRTANVDVVHPDEVHPDEEVSYNLAFSSMNVDY